jgi:hypothetical protein
MITEKIEKLARAMTTAEGWLPDQLASDIHGAGTVSYRNHNPGNLRKSVFALGVRDGFAYFYNDATGFFALQFDLMRKAQGQTTTSLIPDSTLGELLSVYTAETGQTLENYTLTVETLTGFSRAMKIKDLLIK